MNYYCRLFICNAIPKCFALRTRAEFRFCSAINLDLQYQAKEDADEHGRYNGGRALRMKARCSNRYGIESVCEDRAYVIIRVLRLRVHRQDIGV